MAASSSAENCLSLFDLARHSKLLKSFEHSLYLLSSECGYFHYGCDGLDDRGWGCGYRTAQSLCSWAVNRTKSNGSIKEGKPSKDRVTAPSLQEMQATLVQLGDKEPSFIGSKQWIGCFEACILLDHLYNVPCRIIHVTSGSDVVGHIGLIADHFKTSGAPVMIGGDVDAASKTLIGLHFPEQQAEEDARFLVADPHYFGVPSEAHVLDSFVKWHDLKLFDSASFYNFCVPVNPE